MTMIKSGDIRLYILRGDDTVAEMPMPSDLWPRAEARHELAVEPRPAAVQRRPCHVCKHRHTPECLACTFGDEARAAARCAPPLTRRQIRLQRAADRALAHCRKVQRTARRIET